MQLDKTQQTLRREFSPPVVGQKNGCRNVSTAHKFNTVCLVFSIEYFFYSSFFFFESCVILIKIFKKLKYFRQTGLLNVQMKFVCSYPPLLKTKVMDSDIFLSKHKSMIFSLVSSNKDNESLFVSTVPR